MTPELLALAVGARPADAQRYAAALTEAMVTYAVNTPKRQAMFLAQIGQESDSLSKVVESFNYSIEGLHATFPARISAPQAAKLGRQPGENTVPLERQMQIAELVYGGRFSNAHPGDGWKYRGRGLKQVTFADNYRNCGTALGIDLLTHPELLELPDYAARSAGWFWSAHGLNTYADHGDVTGATRIINGGLNGLAERQTRYKKACTALGA